MNHGGGATPVIQVCDTGLNEHVRKAYGDLEARMVLQKCQDGEVVPVLSYEESMMILVSVLDDVALHWPVRITLACLILLTFFEQPAWLAGRGAPAKREES